jgi:triacylglycerol esterase/lipase EstA (alpha/beta hydrolase family)
MSHPLPILFIHGFNGDPGDWTDGGFRQYLLEHGDLDPDLVRLFRYGVAEDGTYNNRGDLRPIAARLAGVGLSDKDRLTSSVDQLSADSVAKGGPAPVTLIAHSLGGIISRYYLSRTTPDEFGTLYRGNVGRLITIASPHRGVDLARLTELVPRGSLGWWFIRLLEKLGLAPALPAQAVEAWEATLNEAQLAERAQMAPEMSSDARVLLTDTPIYQQLHPDSPVLAELNRPGTMPANVTCHCFYGDILVRVAVRAAGLWLVDHTTSFGDLAVPAYSARAIPNVRTTPHPYITEKSLEWTLHVAPIGDEERSLADDMPETQHGKLLSNPAVQDGVLSVLGG